MGGVDGELIPLEPSPRSWALPGWHLAQLEQTGNWAWRRACLPPQPELRVAWD